MHFARIVTPLFLLAACQSAPVGTDLGPTTDAQPVPPEAIAPEPTISLEGWRTELITLPPAFAPGLPPGEEVLLFAPGMFDADSDEYWSYAFLIELEEHEVTAASLTDLLEPYYDGLISAVAEGRGEPVGDNPAQVRVKRVEGDRFEASIYLIDAFVTMEPVVLQMLIDAEAAPAGKSTLRFQASPQPLDHELWLSLQAAAESLEL